MILRAEWVLAFGWGAAYSRMIAGMRDIEGEFRDYYSQLGLLVLMNFCFLVAAMMLYHLASVSLVRWAAIGGGGLLVLLAVDTFFEKTGNYATGTIRSLRNRIATSMAGMVMTGCSLWYFLSY